MEMPDPESPEGGRAELEAWVGVWRGRMVRTAAKILKDRDVAEDVVQDTLLRVWRRAGRARLQRPGAYLTRAVYWNALKQRARHRSMAPLEAAEQVVDSASIGDTEQRILGPLELEVAISELPINQQVVVRLRFYLGLTFAEIGKCLTISANTAASRCRYALASLRRLIAGKESSHE
jgi:RNA polymerase sigma-70 factor (ECF subfamily)